MLIIISKVLNLNINFLFKTTTTKYFSYSKMTSTYSYLEYQNILANEISGRLFKFNNRPSANVKNGIIYGFQRFNSNIINGIYVENMSFFEKSYGTDNSNIVKCNFRGHADIQNETLRNMLTQKIKTNLYEVLKKPLFTDDCRLVLRFGGISTCSGNQEDSRYQSIHFKCSQAKKQFEDVYSTQLCYNRPNTNLVPCLYNNFVYNHKDFNKLRFYVDENMGKFTMFNQEEQNERKFTISHPKIHPDENIYLAYSNKLSGLINILITGVYIKDDNVLSDTMKLWCLIQSSHMISNVSDITTSGEYDDEIDDILNI